MANAQECLGLRSLKYSSANISVNWRVLKNARGPEGRLIFGREHAFGGLRAALLNIGNTNRAYNWGAEAGGSFTLGKSVTLCPLGTYSRQLRASVAYPATTEVLVGGSLGARPYVTSAVKLIPFIGGGVLRTKAEDTIDETAEQVDGYVRTGAEIFGGLGVQLGETVIIRGLLRHRDGYGDRSNMFVLGVTLAPTRK
ncbi:MAG: hypothetical protein H7Z40_02865 [Phycisphaerae bacterium]|nr:hypothetical protein [Gemmatimonadaceae bacterium]